MEYINKEALQKLYNEELDSDLELFEKLFTILMSQFDEIQSFSLSQTSVNEMAELAHKVKSSSRSFGAYQIVSHLETLEQEAKKNNFENAEKHLNEIKKLLEPTLNEIKEVKIKFKSNNRY